MVESKGIFSSFWSNAFVMYKCNAIRPLRYIKFLASVVSGLIGKFQMSHAKHEVQFLDPLIPLLIHKPDGLIYHVNQQMAYFPDTTSKQCKVCSARGDMRRVLFCCKRCGTGLCPVTCFWDYHHLADYPVPV